MRSEKNDFTQGSILKKLAAFMLPILGALVLHCLLYTSDAADE